MEILLSFKEAREFNELEPGSQLTTEESAFVAASQEITPSWALYSFSDAQIKLERWF